MYQGKFDKKGKNSSMSVEEIVASRNRSSRETPSASRPDPTRTAASRTASQSARASQPGARAPQTGARTAPQAQRSAQTDSRAPQQGSRASQSGARAAASRPQSPAPSRRPAPAQAVVAEPERRGPRLGSVIFYTLYFLFIFLFFVGTFLGLNWLHGWLTAYEAAQPTVKCEEVFQQVFGNPDWGALYTAAGIQDTQFEGKEQFVSYMTDLVGNSQLSYQETSAGLSGDKKYFVKLGDQKLAYFTLTPHGSTEKVTLPAGTAAGTPRFEIKIGTYEGQETTPSNVTRGDIVQVVADTAITNDANATWRSNAVRYELAPSAKPYSEWTYVTPTGMVVCGLDEPNTTIKVTATADYVDPATPEISNSVSAALDIPVEGAGVIGFSPSLVTAIQVAAVTVKANKDAQAHAMAVMLDGRKVDVSHQAAWQSDTPANATVSDTGLVHGVATGTAMLTATLFGVSGQGNVIVS